MNLTHQSSLATLRAFKPGDALPTRLQIFKLGRNQSNQGDFVIDEECLAALPSAQRAIGRERIALGFEHNLDEGSEEYERTHEPRAIAGTADVEAVPGIGIFLANINWSQLGAERLPDFEDLSPTPIFDKKSRRVLAIASASLTRTGSVYGLTLENAAAARLSATTGHILDGAGLTGMARVVASFEAQNGRRLHAGRLSAATILRSADPSLTGMARVIATFEAQNQQASAK